MKLYWLSLISILCILGANSQNLTGTWVSNWQNNYLVSSPSATINITNINSTAWNVTYFYPDGASANVAVSKSADNTWTDFLNDTLTYDPDTNSILYTFPDYVGTPLLYGISGSIIPQEQVYGSIGGIWINPTPVDSSDDASDCCAPDSVIITLNPNKPGGLNAWYTYDNPSSSCSSVPTDFIFEIESANTQMMNWTGYDSNYQAQRANQLYYNPLNQSNPLTLVFNAQDGSCDYFYQQPGDTNFISGIWRPDWQNPTNQLNLALNRDSYQITPVGNTYMVSTITDSQHNTRSSFVVQLPGGQYYDYSLGNGMNFTYNESTNTLQFNEFSDATELLSANGSVISAEPFVSFWGSPASTDGASLPDDCCVPYAIHIGPNTHDADVLNVSYYYSENYSSKTQCFALLNQLGFPAQSILSIQNPSIVQLTWLDASGTMIQFTSPTDTSKILVTGYCNGYDFQMSAKPVLPDAPAASSAEWFYYKIVYFIMGLFMILA